MSAFWNAWGPWLGGGGFLLLVTLILSYIARPSSQITADLRADLDALETRRTQDIENMKRDHSGACDTLKREHALAIGQVRQEHAGEVATLRAEFAEARREIGALRESNFHMRVVFTALSVQYNLVRQELHKRDPSLQILTIREIVDESHVPLQNVTMFDPASVGFLWPNGQPVPPQVQPPTPPPASPPPPSP